MNIFDAENLIKKIQHENIRFPKICKSNGHETVKLHKYEEPEYVKLKIPECFEIDETISAIEYSIEKQVANHNAEFLDSWFYEMLNKYGVKKDELTERVSLQITGITNHIFIDRYYSFSFTHGCDFGENGKSYTVWIKPEYIIEMGGMKINVYSKQRWK